MEPEGPRALAAVWIFVCFSFESVLKRKKRKQMAGVISAMSLRLSFTDLGQKRDEDGAAI